MPPSEQPFVSRHKSSTMGQCSRDNESIGWIIMQSCKIKRAHGHRPIDRKFNRPRYE